mmetsp:Transcript_62047/g.106585  ORF Transcript_62047/g.106585 Transcript_62047/m.106585 type:complete len:81 (+) Transcript_62047:26-268(+)
MPPIFSEPDFLLNLGFPQPEATPGVDIKLRALAPIIRYVIAVVVTHGTLESCTAHKTHVLSAAANEDDGDDNDADETRKA